MNTAVNFLLNTIGNIIGAFVGFGLALILQRKTDKAKRYERIKKVVSSIIEEISDISNSIDDYIKVNQVIYHKISVPAWEAILNSGIILDLIDHSIYQNIIKVYSTIKIFNESFEKESEDELRQLMKEIVSIANKIIEESKTTTFI